MRPEQGPSCANQEQQIPSLYPNHPRPFPKVPFSGNCVIPSLVCPSKTLSQPKASHLEVSGEQRALPDYPALPKLPVAALNHSNALFYHAYPCLTHRCPTGLLLFFKHSELFSTSGPLHVFPLPGMLVLLSASMLSSSPVSGIMVRNRLEQYVLKPAVPPFPHL